jgi:hypothetical protein
MPPQGAVNAASIFDPRVLKSRTRSSALILCDDLKSFGFKQFTDAFISKLKGELHRLKARAEQEYDWNNVRGAAAYNNWLRAKVQKQTALEENDPSFDSREERYKTWEDDPAEEARRIWIWWSECRDEFTSFSTALRLVALVQTSSASVERLFSQY